MLKLKINYPKTFIQAPISNGTTKERLQKARLFNLRFYDNLQDVIINNEIAPRTFTKTLNNVTGSKIKLDILRSQVDNEGFLRYCIDGMKGINNGFTLQLPLTNYTEKIHRSSALAFLKATQDFFNEALNPKFLQRFITMFNKGYNPEKALNFFYENVSGEKKLVSENLNNFLKNKKVEEQIHTLQFLRYRLLSEQNTTEAMKNIEKRIEKHNNLKYEHASDYFDMDKYSYDEKLKIIESILKKLIDSGRKK